jgi:phosphohistidine phosphatase
MRRLLLLRHAKSSWDDPGLDDHDRPLAPRGRDAAPLIARHIAARGLTPDLVLSSPAARAVETWELVAPALGPEGAVRFEDGLYATTAGRLLERLARLTETPRTLMLLGHNPELAALTARLTRDGEPAAIAQLAKKFPTAALAVIRLDIDSWADIADGCGYLEELATPKRLRKES